MEQLSTLGLAVSARDKEVVLETLNPALSWTKMESMIRVPMLQWKSQAQVMKIKKALTQ
jgi:hypothetical protein